MEVVGRVKKMVKQGAAVQLARVFKFNGLKKDNLRDTPSRWWRDGCIRAVPRSDPPRDVDGNRSNASINDSEHNTKT